MEQLIILALFGAIALGKWLLENAGKPPENSDKTSEPTHRQSIPERGDSEEEKMRRFMEALGLPAGEDRPAPPARPVAPAAERRFEQEPPPLIQRQPPTPPPQPAPTRRVRPPRQTPMGGPNPWGGQKSRPPRPQPQTPPVLPPESVFTPSVPALVPSFSPSQTVEMTSVSMDSVAPQMEISSFDQGASRKQASGSLVSKLRDPKALRDALVLREILGPPKALSPH